MITDEYIIEKFVNVDKNGRKIVHANNLKRATPEELEYLNKRFDDSDSINETIQRLYLGIIDKPRCPICGNPVKWLGKTKRPYLKTCSEECGFKLRPQNTKQTCIAKYGVENVFQLESVKDISKQTILNRYGVENVQQCKEIHERSKKTLFERYGHSNFGGGEEAKKKMKQTKLLHYGSENYINVEKIRATKLERYGNAYYINIEAIRKTCLERFGTVSYLQSPLYKVKAEEYKKKTLETKKKNKTYTSSKAESYVYNLLTHKFSSLICQYRSDDYPFACDFYIPEIDLYIEYQGYYTHGNHPFDKNDPEDMKELAYLQQKSANHKNKNNLYQVKINVWTNVDPMKRTIAKQNGLNYIEFWNYEQAKNWVDNYGN